MLRTIYVIINALIFGRWNETELYIVSEEVFSVSHNALRTNYINIYIYIYIYIPFVMSVNIPKSCFGERVRIINFRDGKLTSTVNLPHIFAIGILSWT